MTDYQLSLTCANIDDILVGYKRLLLTSSDDQGDDSIVGTIAWHIADLSGNPGFIVLTPGAYNLETEITVPGGVSILGFGYPEITLAGSSDCDMFEVTGDDILIDGLILNGNGANQSRSTSVNIIHATSRVRQFTLTNCTLDSSGSSGLLLDASLAHKNVIVKGNRFIDYYCTGVTYWGVNKGVISENIFDNSGVTPDGNGNGISVSVNSTDVNVFGNNITMGDSQAASFGIEAGSGTSGTDRISITGNTINAGDYSNNGGISVAALSNSTVNGNTVTKAQNLAGIEVTVCDSVSVTGNSISDVDCPGIALNAENYSIVISSNTIDSFTAQGISVSRATADKDDQYGLSIIGNTITNGTGAAAGGNHAIYVNGGPEYGMIISKNLIYNHPNAWGINIIGQSGETHSGYVIEGNTFYNVLTYWLGCTAGGATLTGFLVTGNIVNSDVDITMDGSGHIVKDNYPDIESVTAACTLNRYMAAADLDSTNGNMDLTLADGYYIGQLKTISMSTYVGNVYVYIAHHETNDSEVALFDAVDETGVFVWTGTEWATIKATCTFP